MVNEPVSNLDPNATITVEIPQPGFITFAVATEITVLAFAQAKDDFGFSSRVVPCSPNDTPRGLISGVKPGADLSHLRVALDCEFTDWDAPIGSAREMAIIPPVSGG